MNIRLATAADAPKWLELFRATFGEQYPARIVYDQNWIAQQLTAPTGHETWVAENLNRLESAVSFLSPPSGSATGPILNLGRNLHRSESLVNGGAESLLKSIGQLAAKRAQTIVTRIQVQSNSQQILYENAGYTCVGFQPLKHMLQHRTGTLFYMRPDESWIQTSPRTVLPQALPEIAELASTALERLQLPSPQVVSTDVLGYPLQTDLTITAATAEGYESSRLQAQNANPPVEISGPFNWGMGQFRITSSQPCRALICANHGRTVAGVLFRMDELDRCARIVDAFATDGLSTGALFAQVVKLVEEQLGAAYIEVDILVTATRLLKTTEQLGFVPVAYLPGFNVHGETRTDVVKLVKLNIPYSAESNDLTAHARGIADAVNRFFEDQRLGLATIKLLKPLAMFAGLGDGELRKVSRLFTQKLLRPGEQVFAKGAAGKEAYIVLRGQVDIVLEPNTQPVASLSNGKIFGELAFLDGAPRSTYALAVQPSIVLVLQQDAFMDLARREPALGMAVMRNMAVDLTAKLRNADVEIAKIVHRQN